MKTILVDAVGTFVVDMKINEEMHKLLEQYPNRKIILTNANDEQLATFGLVNMPYDMFTLKHNPDKTDPKYFEAMLSNFNLTPEDVIYFEHSQEAVDSAKSVGITSYFYDAEKKDLESLKTFLDSNC
ncbi:HAD-IA family hydrolase [Candidatus Dojkabacteria bacterium]|nr:HAD-IA family hydrolase [Candidatus Dojkabacteria bacterium]